MKIDYSKPLTAEQSRMVEENHNLIYTFLNKTKLPMDDYYDLAAEGLIRAVQAYSQDERLQQYSLTTIAFWTMKSTVANEVRRYKSRPQIISLDYTLDDYNEPITSFLHSQKDYSTVDQILTRVEVAAAIAVLSLDQKQLLSEIAAGTNQAVIAQTLGLSQAQVSRRLKKTRAILQEQLQEVV